MKNKHLNTTCLYYFSKTHSVLIWNPYYYKILFLFILITFIACFLWVMTCDSSTRLLYIYLSATNFNLLTPYYNYLTKLMLNLPIKYLFKCSNGITLKLNWFFIKFLTAIFRIPAAYSYIRLGVSLNSGHPILFMFSLTKIIFV